MSADDHKNPAHDAAKAPADPMRRIGFYKGGCKGCQACVELLPECFGWDDDEDKPFLKDECAEESRILQCIAYCPEDCIEIEED